MRYIQQDEQHIIANIIEADAELAAQWGLSPDYDGAKIGDTYLPYLEQEKNAKITESKVGLAQFLAENPLLWIDGKRYSITEEKQTLLMSNIASYQIEIQFDPEAELTWNATGEACEQWSFEALCALSVSIAQYVRPLVSYQQKREIEIRKAMTLEELDGIDIDYSEVHAHGKTG